MGDGKKWAAEHCGNCHQWLDDCICSAVKKQCIRHPCRYPRCGYNCESQARYRFQKTKQVLFEKEVQKLRSKYF